MRGRYRYILSYCWGSVKDCGRRHTGEILVFFLNVVLICIGLGILVGGFVAWASGITLILAIAGGVGLGIYDERKAEARRWEQERSTVRCALCGGGYLGLGMGPLQAENCDARVAPGEGGVLYLSCGYGSQKDGNIYEVLSSEEALKNGLEPICDKCIEQAEREGRIIFRGDFYDRELYKKAFLQESPFLTPEDRRLLMQRLRGEWK